MAGILRWGVSGITLLISPTGFYPNSQKKANMKPWVHCMLFQKMYTLLAGWMQIVKDY